MDQILIKSAEYPYILSTLIFLPLAGAILLLFIRNESFAKYYANEGRPAKPIRLMVGLLLLKQLNDLSDEDVVIQWIPPSTRGNDNRGRE